MVREWADLGLQHKMNKLILALDQSTQKTGWAIYDLADKKLINYGKIDPVGELWPRLIILKNNVKELIKKYSIGTLIIEEIQLQNIPGTSKEGNVATFKKLAYVQAILIELAIELNIPCEIIASSSWKSICGVKGTKRAEQKQNAQKFVEYHYGIRATQDECDAICIGHAHCVNCQHEDEGIFWE